MQMLKRLLLIVVVVFLVSGCAKPPVAELESARDVVARASAAGATQYAPREYQLASSALQAAELQVSRHEYTKGARTLELAQRYANEALRLTLAARKELAAQREKAAEEKRQAEIQRQLELQRQAELKQQRAARQRVVKKKQQKKVQVQVKKAPTVEAKPKLVSKVEVRSGEDLAKIAARKEVYADPYLWPLIYKANRDQIKDPTKIFAGQTLVVPRDKSRDEADAARREAREAKLFDLGG